MNLRLCPSIYLPTYLPICLSICIYPYLFIYPSLHGPRSFVVYRNPIYTYMLNVNVHVGVHVNAGGGMNMLIHIWLPSSLYLSILSFCRRRLLSISPVLYVPIITVHVSVYAHTSTYIHKDRFNTGLHMSMRHIIIYTQLHT